ncbi:hypothetical protein GCM10025865_02430 [Paraoerskovia sediminicola]|uniref:Prephenate dehydratase n=1 Tax=Paraoerskovia sediminicola TaxID=1138587 RepID=A0ABN6X8M3_9CELL|nr:hypothetical protein [Paraoerskovia sediminicola]BDZ40944.1 hypothetical protein GCM10025865_02430 [Paraoerskovia sediminicola]
MVGTSQRHGGVTAGGSAGASAEVPTPRLVPLDGVGAVYGAVASGDVDLGVVAIESTVEGYVVPSSTRSWVPRTWSGSTRP